MNPFQIARRGLVQITAVIVSVVAFTAAWADPPGRVARLSEFAGDVQIAQGNNTGWQPISRNYPITAGDNVWVSEGGRAELDVGPVQVWLSGGANVYFDRFDDHTLNARLSTGAIAVRIRQWESGDTMMVSTPHGEISFAQPGLYFVSAGNANLPSVVNARFGQAELNAFGRRQWVSRGEALAFDGRGVIPERYASGYYSGGFDGWVVARDRRAERWEARNRDVGNPWMIGVRDLDDHGYWEESYEYGRVWYPRAISTNWAPYRYGLWSYVQPWGWTWVDDAPWGFAPFHYGRWVRLGSRWAWTPGTYVGRAVYAPALVSFYGGNGWSVNASVGPSYSWVPLGWNEPYAPWYTYSPNYWRHVNRPYVRNVAEDPWRPPTHIHAGVPGAITAVAAATFLGGRHIAQNQIRTVTEVDVRSAPPARINELVPIPRMGRGGIDPNPIVRQQQPPIQSSVQPQPQRGAGQAVFGAAPPTVYAVERGATTSNAPLPNTAVVQPRVWQDPNPVAPRANVGREVVQGDRRGAPQFAQPGQPTPVAPAVQSYPNPQLQQIQPQPQQPLQPSAPPAVVNRAAPAIERVVPPQPEAPRPRDRSERLERKPAYEPRAAAPVVNPLPVPAPVPVNAVAPTNRAAPPVNVAQPPQQVQPQPQAQPKPGQYAPEMQRQAELRAQQVQPQPQAQPQPARPAPPPNAERVHAVERRQSKVKEVGAREQQ
jgi:hypothetical protein